MYDESPLDLRRRVGAPVGAGARHLAARQRLRDAVRAARRVVGVGSPARLARPQQRTRHSELAGAPAVARDGGCRVGLRPAGSTTTPGGGAPLSPARHRRRRRSGGRRRGGGRPRAARSCACLLADPVLALELDRAVAQARELRVQRVERRLLLGERAPRAASWAASAASAAAAASAASRARSRSATSACALSDGGVGRAPPRRGPRPRRRCRRAAPPGRARPRRSVVAARRRRAAAASRRRRPIARAPPPTRPSRVAEAAASAAAASACGAKRAGARLRAGARRFGGGRRRRGLDRGVAESAGLGLELVDERRDARRPRPRAWRRRPSRPATSSQVGIVLGGSRTGGHGERRDQQRPRPPSPSIRRARAPPPSPASLPTRTLGGRSDTQRTLVRMRVDPDRRDCRSHRWRSSLVGVLARCGARQPSPPASADCDAPASPSPTPLDPIAAWVDERMSQLLVEQKAAALLMLHAPGTDPAPLRAFVDAGVSGLILMGDNIAGATRRRSRRSPRRAGRPRRARADRHRRGGRRGRSASPWDARGGAEQLCVMRPPAAHATPSRARAATLAASGVERELRHRRRCHRRPRLVHLRSGARHRPRRLGRTRRRGGRRRARRRREHAQALPGPRCGAGRLALERPAAPLSLDEWRAGPAHPVRAPASTRAPSS